VQPLDPAMAAQQCNRCKHWKHEQEYDVGKRSGEPLKMCRECTAKVTAYKKSPTGRAVQKKFNNSDARKKKVKVWRSTDSGMKSIDKSKKSEATKLKRKLHNQTKKRREANKEYKKKPRSLEKAKKARSLWKKTASGKAALKRGDKNKYNKIKQDPGQLLQSRMRLRMYALMTKTRLFSKTLHSNSEFTSSEDVAAHFESKISHPMTMGNYGRVWHIEHTIACCWYDHSDLEDVRRCWSKANLNAMLGPDNLKKSYFIEDADVDIVPPEYWPKSWNGRIPSQAEKRVMYSRVRKGSK
jgi:hypothetical protein